MRKLLYKVLSFTLLPDQNVDLRREFEKLDIEGRGEITLAFLKQGLMHSAGSHTFDSLSEEMLENIFNAISIQKSTQLYSGTSSLQLDRVNAMWMIAICSWP
jgi:Ca2+-binding EF-hand superfamily protein